MGTIDDDREDNDDAQARPEPRRGSDFARALANHSLAHSAVSSEFSETARDHDRLTRREAAALRERGYRRLREVADACHDAARALWLINQEMAAADRAADDDEDAGDDLTPPNGNPRPVRGGKR